MAECLRNTEPWQSHPQRMLRHKAFIQGARMAFGFSGIYDEDEARQIIIREEKDITPANPVQHEEIISGKDKVKTLPTYPQEKFDGNLEPWKKAMIEGRLPLPNLRAKIETQFVFTDLQLEMLHKIEREAEEERKQQETESTNEQSDFVKEMENEENRNGAAQ
jgi:hypothetical protein